jgi:hypothetical protein
MNLTKKYFVITYIAVLIAAIVTGIIFYHTVVGNDSTNIFSVIFGWQWIYLAVISIAVLVVASIKRNKRLAWAAGIIAASLAIVLIPARFVEFSRIYITGDGGPAGPEFACLVWDNSKINLRSGAYSDSFGLCTVMSIPSYNKFLIDRSRNADQLDATGTYYVMLGLNEMVLLGGGLLAYKKLGTKTLSSC